MAYNDNENCIVTDAQPWLSHAHWSCDTHTGDVTHVFRRTYSKMSAVASQYSGGGTKTVSMFSKLMSQASSFAMEGVKNLVVKKHVSW